MSPKLKKNNCSQSRRIKIKLHNRGCDHTFVQFLWEFSCDGRSRTTAPHIWPHENVDLHINSNVKPNWVSVTVRKHNVRHIKYRPTIITNPVANKINLYYAWLNSFNSINDHILVDVNNYLKVYRFSKTTNPNLIRMFFLILFVVPLFIGRLVCETVIDFRYSLWNTK